MKKSNLIKTALLAVASVGILGASASAAVLSYSPGDLFLGFHATSGTGATLDYLVDIGRASTFRDATSNMTLAISGIGADLTNTFGANWSTDSNLYWGIYGSDFGQDVTEGGTTDPANTLYAARAETIIGTQATPYIRQLSGVTGNVASNMDAMGTFYGSISLNSTNNNPVGLIQAVTDTNSYASFQDVSGGTSFGAAFIGGGEGNFANGASGTALDLFRLTARTGANQPGSYEGSFEISSTGVLTYTAAPPTAVPEPSTYGLVIGAGALLLVVFRRRARANA